MFRFIIGISSFELRKPEHKLFKYRDIQIVVNEVLPPRFRNEPGFFQQGEVVGDGSSRKGKAGGDFPGGKPTVFQENEDISSNGI